MHIYIGALQRINSGLGKHRVHAIHTHTRIYVYIHIYICMYMYIYMYRERYRRARAPRRSIRRARR